MGCLKSGNLRKLKKWYLLFMIGSVRKREKRRERELKKLVFFFKYLELTPKKQELQRFLKKILELKRYG